VLLIFEHICRQAALGDNTFDEYINVLTVRLNVSYKGKTLEELLDVRRSTAFDLYQNLKLEAWHDRFCGDEVCSLATAIAGILMDGCDCSLLFLIPPPYISSVYCY